MSAINAWISNNKFIIATDTLCQMNTKYGNVARNFVTKVYHIPQYKCCFSSQGLRDLGLEFFNFTQTDVRANNLETLLNFSKKFKLSTKYDEVSFTQIGTIFLFGYNENSNKLEVYKSYFDENRNIHFEKSFNDIDDYNIMIKPSVGLDYELIKDELKWNNFDDIKQSLIKITIEQKRGFDRNCDPFIGGQIELNIIEYSNNIYSAYTEIIYTFEDYIRVSNSIISP